MEEVDPVNEDTQEERSSDNEQLENMMKVYERYLSQPVGEEGWEQMWRKRMVPAPKKSSDELKVEKPINVPVKGLSDAEWAELLGF
ncbi:Hypothetical predicted protein [Paramuricea clavata]|uniref:Uncharacterized protein n=1 Tax=Paramuricea clavata TaxID=317549 RepID=A0A7D9I5I0_PARCT|nr:Hypothetical predicted protein [Paramuricea clavata]